MKTVKVIGGGFSGLITAYYLSREGFSVELHEATSRLGGMLGTERTYSGLVESAANGFILNDDLMEVFRDLHLEPLKPRAQFAKKRYVYREGLKRWPLNFSESFLLIFKFLFNFVFSKNSLHPKADETIWNWGLRNLNLSATKYLLSPGLQGIYAGNARKMSAELILAPLFQKKKQKYRGTVSTDGGMGEFIDFLVLKLKAQNVKIFLNSNYQLESLTDPHVVAVSAAAAPTVIEKVAPAAAAVLKQIEILPVLSVTVFYKVASKKIEGFGGLFPEDQGFKVLGILSPTYIFSSRGPEYSETWIFGGTHSPEMLDKTDSEILAVILQERAKILGGEASIESSHIYRWPKALPHYTLAHKNLLKQLQLPANLYLVGNYLGVIGLSKILSRCKKLAAQMKRTLS